MEEALEESEHTTLSRQRNEEQGRQNWMRMLRAFNARVPPHMRINAGWRSTVRRIFLSAQEGPMDNDDGVEKDDDEEEEEDQRHDHTNSLNLILSHF